MHNDRYKKKTIKNFNVHDTLYISKKNSEWYKSWIDWTKETLNHPYFIKHKNKFYPEICKIKISNDLFTENLSIENLTKTNENNEIPVKILKITNENYKDYMFLVKQLWNVWTVEYKKKYENIRLLSIKNTRNFTLYFLMWFFNIIGIDMTDENPNLFNKIIKTNDKFVMKKEKCEGNKKKRGKIIEKYGYLHQYPLEAFIFPFFKNSNAKTKEPIVFNILKNQNSKLEIECVPLQFD